MRIAIVDTTTRRAEELKRAFVRSGYQAEQFASARDHLGDTDWANAEVVFLHFSDRQQADWSELEEGGRYHGKRVVLYAGGVTVWRQYVSEYRDKLFCKYDRVVGEPPDATVIEDFLRYLRAVQEGQQGPLCDILNGIDWALEAKLELLSRVLEQVAAGRAIDIEKAGAAMDKNLLSILMSEPDAREILQNPRQSLLDLRNALLPDEPEWVRR